MGLESWVAALTLCTPLMTQAQFPVLASTPALWVPLLLLPLRKERLSPSLGKSQCS